MKKKTLLALASLAAFNTAWAQSSGVTIFGVADLAYARINGSTSRFSGLVSGNNVGSQIGFRGIEDLGGGMAASFWMEAGLNIDAGSGTATNSNNQLSGTSRGVSAITFNRRSTVSLSGGFGELRLGRDYIPTFVVDATYDPFVASTGIASSMMVHTQAFMANSGAIYPRASNSIGYFTPAGLGGFYGQAMLAFGENPSNAANDEDGKHVGLRLGWGAGPFDISVATGTTQQTPAAATPTAPAQTGDYRASNLGAAYNFGVAKLTFEYMVTKVDSFGGIAGRTQDGKGWLIGAIVPMGVGQLRASYSTVKLDVNGTPVGSPGKLALGYTHNLSKRTALYATYTQIRNCDGSSLTPGLSAFASTGPNTTSRAYELGMRHVF